MLRGIVVIQKTWRNYRLVAKRLLLKWFHTHNENVGIDR